MATRNMIGRPGVATGPPEHWPVWLAPLAFLAGLCGALMASGVVIVAASILDERGSGGANIAATVAQDAIFVGAAVLLAAQVARPRAEHFGLRRIPAGRAISWTLIGIVGFYAFALLYGALISTDGEQETLETLGTDRSTALLIASGALVVLLAPFAEEIFFRGFAYRALRNRMGVWPAAGVIGLVFGSIHYSGPDTLVIIPVLAVLGAVFCLLYERTGSLYPAIALHVVNNAVAFSRTADSAAAPAVAAAMGVVALAICANYGLGRGPTRPVVITSDGRVRA